MSRHIDQTAYCHRQAAECARAALEATLAEVREAYLDLEQGWLNLPSEKSDNQKSSAEIEPSRRIASAPGRARSRLARPRS
jgi:hypothetical protein